MHTAGETGAPDAALEPRPCQAAPGTTADATEHAEGVEPEP